MSASSPSWMARSAAGAPSDRVATPDAGAATGEIYVIYVHPSDWARGIGRALRQRALQELRANAFDEVTVWSFDENERANAFYERRGFHRDGAEQRNERYGRALEVRYKRSL
jgi:GNAT superfamily N-acetyltransferase